MNKTERDEARELLQLEAKLVRLRIAASHLKQRQLKEQDDRKSDTQTDAAVHDKPYYAMGFAALAGLVVGVLLNRR